MATKAQIARGIAERSGEKRPKRPARKRGDVPVDTAAPGVSATDKKRGSGSTATRNASQHAARSAAYALDDSATGKPSRKSTRGSANASKPDSNLQRRQIRKTRSPSTRAAKAEAKKR